METKGIAQRLGGESKKSGKDNIAVLLFKARTDIHLTHLEQKSKTLATHEALKIFYESVLDLIDTYVETYMGIDDSFKAPDVPASAVVDNPLEYFKALYKNIETLRIDVKETFLQNQIDEMQQLIAHTMYRLKRITT